MASLTGSNPTKAKAKKKKKKPKKLLVNKNHEYDQELIAELSSFFSLQRVDLKGPDFIVPGVKSKSILFFVLFFSSSSHLLLLLFFFFFLRLFFSYILHHLFTSLYIQTGVNTLSFVLVDEADILLKCHRVQVTRRYPPFLRRSDRSIDSDDSTHV